MAVSTSINLRYLLLATRVRKSKHEDVIEPWDILKLLSDATRLRILVLLSKEELSVAELQEILDMGQSRISSHLALLRQAEVVNDRKEGKRTYYSLVEDLDSASADVLHTSLKAVHNHPDIRNDAQILSRVIEKRRQITEQYFNEVAGRLGKNYCPGRSWEAIGHFLFYLTPPIDIADLGAGEGVISHLLAKRAKSVYCIDNSPRMVEVGTQLAKDHGLDNLIYKLGDIEKVPLADESVDLAILSQALHHAEHPETAVREAARILRPGGQLIILDLKEHNFERARDLYADRWLGFTENTLYQYLKKAGLKQVEVNTVSREEVEPFFETLLAAGTK